MTTISSSSATPVAYAHPYIVCHNGSSKSLSLWTCTGEPLLYATLEGEESSAARSHVVAPDRIVTQSVYDLQSTILVHSLPDGQLLDVLALGSGVVQLFPGGFVAKWGDRGEDLRGNSQAYGLAENGKLTTPAIWTALWKTYTFHPIHPKPSILWQMHLSIHKYTIPNPLLAGARPDHMPHAVINPMLRGAVPTSSPLFVMAHHESVFGVDELYPKTALCSLDAQTLALSWCTLIGQRTRWLRYSACTATVVAYGWMDIKQGMGVIVVDTTTGTVLRTESIGTPKEKCGPWVHCGLTPSEDTLVVVFGDGQLVVMPLATFIANGFAREGDDMSPVTIPCPEFALSTPRKAKEKRSKAHGMWIWMRRVFIADRVVVVVPTKGSEFVILRW
ncbi:hypothetical protein C8F04DRAFT_1392037 [Mycena alexandri]|uniref:Uncharacterized protein n=1 Tax=Mycena alexandri TaxID=1745969 RepID=A0AAD6T4P3_9AGAR|nr:hypothetical protein C8F04DRAFT_1392037 [Mycena alexandri]